MLTQRELISNFVPFAACLRRQGSAYAKLLVPDRRPTSGVLLRETSYCPEAAAEHQSGAGRDAIVMIEGPLASSAR